MQQNSGSAVGSCCGREGRKQEWAEAEVQRCCTLTGCLSQLWGALQKHDLSELSQLVVRELSIGDVSQWIQAALGRNLTLHKAAETIPGVTKVTAVSWSLPASRQISPLFFRVSLGGATQLRPYPTLYSVQIHFFIYFWEQPLLGPSGRRKE